MNKHERIVNVFCLNLLRNDCDICLISREISERVFIGLIILEL